MREATNKIGSFGKHPEEKENIRKWESLLESIEGFSLEHNDEQKQVSPGQTHFFGDGDEAHNHYSQVEPIQLWERYILIPGTDRLLVIDQRAAHERVLYESILKDLAQQTPVIQKLLWPETLQFQRVDAALIKELLPHLQYLGFDMAEFGHDTYIIHGIPAIMTDLVSPQQAIDDILDRFKEGHLLEEMKPIEKIALALASSLSRKRGEHMTQEEMQVLIERLMTSENPYRSPGGKKTFVTFDREEIFRRFQS